MRLEDWQLGLICTSIAVGTLLYLAYLHLTPVNKHKARQKERYKQQYELFIENMEKLEVDGDTVCELLEKMETYEQLKAKNKLISKQILKHKL